MFQAMEAQVDAGHTKAIGLSNFNITQIERILQAARIPPANLQVELHVFCQQQELVDFCKEHNIVVCAYSPLGSRGTAKLYEQAGIRCELILVCYVQSCHNSYENFCDCDKQVYGNFLQESFYTFFPQKLSKIRE
jgi:diketogulonate reductase-like aldo/keto reductase